MASPQIKGGYTKIANEILEALSLINLSAYEWRVLIFIIRKTYGFHKKTDWISLSQFKKALSIRRRHIHRALKSLSSKQVIITYRGDRFKISYGFQKNYSKWSKSPRRVTVTYPGDEVSPIEGTGCHLSRDFTPINTKDTLTKETSTKDKEIYCRVVEYLNIKTGKLFKYKTKTTQAFINARINDGFNEQDFFTVIDNKCSKWLSDPKMMEFLRPQTLFGTKFESYLQDIPHPLQGIVSSKTMRNIENLKRLERKSKNEK